MAESRPLQSTLSVSRPGSEAQKLSDLISPPNGEVDSCDLPMVGSRTSDSEASGSVRVAPEGRLPYFLSKLLILPFGLFSGSDSSANVHPLSKTSWGHSNLPPRGQLAVMSAAVQKDQTFPLDEFEVLVQSLSPDVVLASPVSSLQSGKRLISSIFRNDVAFLYTDAQVGTPSSAGTPATPTNGSSAMVHSLLRKAGITSPTTILAHAEHTSLPTSPEVTGKENGSSLAKDGSSTICSRVVTTEINRPIDIPTNTLPPHAQVSPPRMIKTTFKSMSSLDGVGPGAGTQTPSTPRREESLSTGASPHGTSTHGFMSRHVMRLASQQGMNGNTGRIESLPSIAATCSTCKISLGLTGLQYLQLVVAAHEGYHMEQSFHFVQHAIDADKNNPLSLMLRGIYLRHGWGCAPDHRKSYESLYRALKQAYCHVSGMVKRSRGIPCSEAELTMILTPITPTASAFTTSPRVNMSPSSATFGTVHRPIMKMGISTLPLSVSPTSPTPSPVPPKQPAELKKYRETPLQPPPFEASPARAMLALILYEMSSSHRFGWGIPKDKQLARYLMRLAANMGDTDACVAVGTQALKESNKRLASKYFRWASFGGWSDYNMGWVFKEKYDFVAEL